MILVSDSMFHHFPVKTKVQESDTAQLIETKNSNFQLIESIKRIFESIIDVIKSLFTSNYTNSIQNLIKEIKASGLEESKYLNHEDPEIRELSQKSSLFIQNLTSHFSSLKNHENIDLSKEREKNKAIECFNLIFDYYKDVNKYLKRNGETFVEADTRMPAIIGNLLSGQPSGKSLKIIDSVCDKMIDFFSWDEEGRGIVATEMHAISNYLMEKLGLHQR